MSNVTVNGTPGKVGQSGQTPGAGGSAGGSGGQAVASANSPSNPANTANADAGSGGSGGNGAGGTNDGRGGAGGAGGAGGSATATATNDSNTKTGATAAAQADGGGGGSAGSPGPPGFSAPYPEGYGVGAAGAAGGSASAAAATTDKAGSATTSAMAYGGNGGTGEAGSTSGAGGAGAGGGAQGSATGLGATTTVSIFGGGGGQANGPRATGGNGAGITDASAVAISTNADQAVAQLDANGGAGGQGDDGASGGKGASVSLDNAVRGTTAGGFLTLEQSAVGGGGGSSLGGKAGAAGNASSIIVLGDKTSASIDSQTSATGGDGGSGGDGTNGSVGGLATASDEISGIGTVDTSAEASGGAGGSDSGDTGDGGAGGAALAHAIATTTADSGATDASSEAIGGSGGDAYGAGMAAGMGGVAQNTSATANGVAGGAEADVYENAGSGGAGINGAAGGDGGDVGAASAVGTASGAADISVLVAETGGMGGGSDSGSAGNGAAVSIDNAVSGSTVGGDLNLAQDASGGAGGSSNAGGAAGTAGAATSTLAVEDSTSKSVSISTSATGGAGGEGGGAGANGAVGASGTANATLDGAQGVSATASGIGGNGGSSGNANGATGGAADADVVADSSSTATADTALATAQAIAGTGGDGNGAGGSGGVGGAVTGATATASSGGSVTQADVSASAGAGGFGSTGAKGGAGGIISGTVQASATDSGGGNATADVTATGGDGGGSDIADGGTGANVTLTNAALGSSPGGTIVLDQTAQGGGGGNGGGANAGSGGTAVSNISQIDSSAANVQVSDTGMGGSGGYGSASTPGGAGGDGTANVAEAAAGTVYVTAEGQGGAGGSSAGGDGGAGGTGDATATAETSNANDGATAVAYDYGGYGGDASGAGSKAATGAVADSVVASATSLAGTATATATAYGGAGGSGTNGAEGGAGGAANLENAVSASSATGPINLQQTANGGIGGNSDTGAGGAGGAATSNLTATTNTTGALDASSEADGGSGGSGSIGGAAGTAIAILGVTGAGAVSGITDAFGGNNPSTTSTSGAGPAGGAATSIDTARASGGSGNVSANSASYAGNGGTGSSNGAGGAANASSTADARLSTGQATASSTATAGMAGGTGVLAAADADALAETANGQLATAAASTTGSNGIASAAASTNGGILADLVAAASAATAGTASANAQASEGSAYDTSSGSGDAYALAGGRASYSDPGVKVAAVFNETGFTDFGTGAIGAAYDPNATGAVQYKSSIAWTVNPSAVPSGGELDLGLVNGTVQGSGFTNLIFEVTERNLILMRQTFTSVAQADTYFEDDLKSFALPSSGTAPLNVTVSLSETLDGTGNGYGVNFMLGAHAAPAVIVNQFQHGSASTSGTLVGDYLWSNAANWLSGVPYDYESAATSLTGYDDISSLILATLTESSGGEIDVVSTLSISSLAAGGLDSGLLADGAAIGATTPVIISVGSITGSGGAYGANGPTSTFVGNSSVDPGADYYVEDRGTVLLSAAPAANSELDFLSGTGTIALEHPGATISAALENLQVGDVLELPGTSAGIISFGSASLTITTNTGTYDFSSVSYAGSGARSAIAGYSATVDAATGLEAITFNSVDSFERNVSNSGNYDWSNPDNWSSGVPINGSSVNFGESPEFVPGGYDDIGNLFLDSVSIQGGYIAVAGTLTIGDVNLGNPSNDQWGIYADSLGDASRSRLVIDSIATRAGSYGAYGTGAVTEILSGADLQEFYQVGEGGQLILSSAPASASGFSYALLNSDSAGSTLGTISFENLGSIVPNAFIGVDVGDVLEVPGNSITNVHMNLGFSNLTITTNAGTYTFSDFGYSGSVDGYTAKFDTATGLEAVTFTGPDDFLTVETASSGPYAGSRNYLWSNASNWSTGLPADGAAVSIEPGDIGYGIDDIAGLSLASVAEAASFATEVVSDLTIGTLNIVNGRAGLEVLDAATLKLDTVIGSAGYLEAFDVGSVLEDLSSDSLPERYIVGVGGEIILAGAPAAGSVLQYGVQSTGGSGALTHADLIGTIAFENPDALTTAKFKDVQIGDVLELPGSSVSSVSFGTASLTITTNDGTYTFSAFYPGSIDGYTAKVDPATGLEAITFTGPDDFLTVETASSGPNASSRNYLWSNASNWSTGLPADGAAVSIEPGDIGYGIDDIAGLSLASVAEAASITTEVVSDLTVGTLNIVNGRAGLEVLDAATLKLDTVIGSAGYLEAFDVGSVLEDLSSDSLPERYIVGVGGEIILAGAPAAGSVLQYGVQSTGGSGALTHADLIGTIAFENPDALTTAKFEDVQIGDVLELPGSSVSSVSFGTASLTITTNDGTYTFSAFYPGSIDGYTAKVDPATGLEAITFTGPDDFLTVETASSGPNASSRNYLWSNASNWSTGLPADGAAVSIEPGDIGYGIDDIAGLSLASVAEAASITTEVVSDLTVGTLNIVNGRAGLEVLDAATLKLDTVIGSAGYLEAFDVGSVLEDLSSDSLPERYIVGVGGEIILAGAPAAGSVLQYGVQSTGGSGALTHADLIGTIAFENPDALTTAKFEDVQIGDVLELPGSSVSSVSFGTASLTITTNDGTYTFSAFYPGSIDGYTAKVDPATGLEAITFTGPDDFLTVETASSGPNASSRNYLWSNASNWSTGLPADGAAVSIEPGDIGYGIDDIAGLSLASVAEAASITTEVVSDLTVGTLNIVNGRAGLEVLDAATLKLDTVIGSAGYLEAFDVGSVLEDLSSDSLPERYIVGVGGEIILAGAPAAGSVLQYGVQSTGGSGALTHADLIGTIAFENPDALTTAKFEDVQIGDVLELPGSSVSSVSFGTASLTITTNDGTYTFSAFGQSGSIDGYTAKVDTATGLEAITFVAPPPPPPSTTFNTDFQTTTGPYGDLFVDGGLYNFLWSSSANWSPGLPADADAVTAFSGSDSGLDNIPGLTLASLTQPSGSKIGAVADLTIATLGITGLGTKLAAFGEVSQAAPATITVDTVVGNGATLEAYGAGGVFNDLATEAVTETYDAAAGGAVILATSPGAGSFLEYRGLGTFAFEHPGATITAALEDVQGGDVLELPGSSVSDVSFGTSSLTITTNAGIYIFDDVSYQGSVVDYTAAEDPATGLEAITFIAPTTFMPNQASANGPYDGRYLWSDSANWTNGAPGHDGDAIVGFVPGSPGNQPGSPSDYTLGTDDIKGLVLDALTLTSIGSTLGLSITDVVSDLTVKKLDLEAGYNQLIAIGGATAGETATITVDTIVGSAGILIGDGIGGDIDVAAPSAGASPGEFAVENGGEVILAASPGAGSIMDYGAGFGGDPNGTGTFAFEHPGATVAAELEDVQGGDVLELPGSSVSDVSFGTSSLTITTNAGTYLFNNVGYLKQPDGYIATHDAATGLEAITFTVTSPATSFQLHDTVTSGPYSGDFLWDDAANWSAGIPSNGDSVGTPPGSSSTSSHGVDNVPDLTLASFSQAPMSVTEILADLTIGSLTNDGTLRLDNTGALTVTGNVTGTGSIIDDPAIITLDGAVSAGQTISLVGSGNVLNLGDPSQFAGTITGFVAGDIIDLENFVETGFSFTSIGLELIGKQAGIAATATLDIIGSFTTASFDISPDSAGTGSVLAILSPAAPGFASHGGTLTEKSTSGSWVLNLGTANVGSSALSAELSVLNTANGPADLLGGSYTISGGSPFINSGFSTFGSLGAGGTADAGSVSLPTNEAGTFSETVVLRPTDTEGSNSPAALSPQTVTITGTIVKPTGTAEGDVHMVTFDGLHYNFQAAGDFVLARSTTPGNSFQIQMRAEKYQAIPGTSVATEIAAQVGQDVVSFGVSGPATVSVNGIADTAIGHQAVQQVLDGGALTALSSTSYELTWKTGETLTVTDSGGYLNMSVVLAPQDKPGSVQGLLGSDSGQANDIQLPDGTVLAQPVPTTTLLGSFADAWRVAPSASLLDAGSQDATAQIGVPSTQPAFDSMSFLSAAANDQIAITGGGEILTGSAAAGLLNQATLPGITFRGTLVSLGSDIITNFGSKDFIDITDLKGGSATTLSAGSTAGVLHVAYGGLSANISIRGYVSCGVFQAAPDGHGGTLIREVAR